VNNFNEMGFEKSIIKAIEAKNYTTATPIQAQAIPVIQNGNDVLGIAQTGTGKTAAFALPILDRLFKGRQDAPKRGCRALIIAPTRELCVQITTSFETYGRFTGLKVLALYGGVAYKGQINALIRGVDIIVATPGRLVDHMQEGNLRLNATEILVLDEVDQMLDLGFITPIRKIVARLPEQRQNLFFSATMPKEIQKFASELLNNPVRVEVARVAAAQEKVEQSVIHIEAGKKRALLCDLMEQKDYSKVLIFTRTKHGADKVAKHLGQFGVKHGIIHGDKNQNQRQKSLEAFREGRVRTLVATDVAARGIDVAGISHVINFDMPLTPEAYVHRIGRTARAGAIGKSISFCTPQENAQLRSIEKLIAQTIPKLDRRNDNTLILDKHLVPDENVEPQTEIIKEKPQRSEGRERSGNRDRSRSNGQGRSFESRAPRGEYRNADQGNAPRFENRRERSNGPQINYDEELRVMLDYEDAPWQAKTSPQHARPEVSGDFKFDRRPKPSRNVTQGTNYRDDNAASAPRAAAKEETRRPEYKPPGGRREARGEFNAQKRAPRPDGRNEGRSFENRGPRTDARNESRSFENRGPRTDARNEGRSFENRGPRTDARNEGRSFENRGPRPEGRNEGRSFENRGPRPEGRSEGRSFENRGPRPEGRSDAPRGNSFKPKSNGNFGKRPPQKSKSRTFA